MSSAPKVGVPARTVSRILRRHSVPYLRECDPMTGEVIRSSKPTAVRYERDRPGELVHMDVKKLGRIPDGGGWQAHGRAATVDRPRRRSGPGSATTTSTRSSTTTPGWPTPRSSPTRRAPPARRSCERAAAYFAEQGITRIERVHDRQRLRLPLLPRRQARRARPSAHGRSSSSPTAPGRTARSSASTGPWPPSGPTGRPSPATPTEPQPLRPGSSTTTLNDATAHSAASPRSADCHQRAGRVHLVAQIDAGAADPKCLNLPSGAAQVFFRDGQVNCAPRQPECGRGAEAEMALDHP